MRHKPSARPLYRFGRLAGALFTTVSSIRISRVGRVSRVRVTASEDFFFDFALYKMFTLPLLQRLGLVGLALGLVSGIALISTVVNKAPTSAQLPCIYPLFLCLFVQLMLTIILAVPSLYAGDNCHRSKLPKYEVVPLHVYEYDN